MEKERDIEQRQHPFLHYVTTFVRGQSFAVWMATILLTALAVWINYGWDLNAAIFKLSETGEWLSWFLVFAVLFTAAYLVQAIGGKRSYLGKSRFWLLLILASFLFAWKMSFDHVFPFSGDPFFNKYLNQVFYWPFKVTVVTIILLFVWVWEGREPSVFGLRTKGFKWKPYVFMLLAMVPLVALASTQPDFLATYPKLKAVQYLSGKEGSWWYKLVFELAYGIDFFSIELFFRGFLVLAFAKYAGRDAILPMAVFYCAIHFGKPMGECISSFFGGTILGILTYHTKNIWGGLMAHLGIAWLMELGGYLGNL